MNLTTTLSTFIVRVTTILVSPIGFEPMTYALEVRCSIQLSYGDVKKRKHLSTLTVVLDFTDGWFPVTCYECTIEQGPSLCTLGHFELRLW